MVRASSFRGIIITPTTKLSFARWVGLPHRRDPGRTVRVAPCARGISSRFDSGALGRLTQARLLRRMYSSGGSATLGVATLRKRTRRVDSYPWDRQDVSNSVQDILTSLEIAEIDVQVRRSLQRILYRKNQFDQDGRGHIILLLRTILESENNGSAALVDTIVCGVSASMDPQWTRTGLRWLEAFDRIPLMSILQTMRELDLFSDDSLGHYFSIAIRNKVSAILEPVGREASKPVRVEPKPPRAISQVAGVEKNIALGLELLALRFEIK